MSQDLQYLEKVYLKQEYRHPLNNKNYEEKFNISNKEVSKLLKTTESEACQQKYHSNDNDILDNPFSDDSHQSLFLNLKINQNEYSNNANDDQQQQQEQQTMENYETLNLLPTHHTQSDQHDANIDYNQQSNNDKDSYENENEFEKEDEEFSVSKRFDSPLNRSKLMVKRVKFLVYISFYAGLFLYIILILNVFLYISQSKHHQSSSQKQWSDLSEKEVILGIIKNNQDITIFILLDLKPLFIIYLAAFLSAIFLSITSNRLMTAKPSLLLVNSNPHIKSDPKKNKSHILNQFYVAYYLNLIIANFLAFGWIHRVYQLRQMFSTQSQEYQNFNYPFIKISIIMLYLIFSLALIFFKKKHDLLQYQLKCHDSGKTI